MHTRSSVALVPQQSFPLCKAFFGSAPEFREPYPSCIFQVRHRCQSAFDIALTQQSLLPNHRSVHYPGIPPGRDLGCQRTLIFSEYSSRSSCCVFRRRIASRQERSATPMKRTFITTLLAISTLAVTTARAGVLDDWTCSAKMGRILSRWLIAILKSMGSKNFGLPTDRSCLASQRATPWRHAYSSANGPPRFCDEDTVWESMKWTLRRNSYE